MACSDSDDTVIADIITATTDIRVIHASPDAPPVNVLLSGTEAITGLDYAQSSGFARINAGDYDITVEGIIPSGNAVVIDVPDITLAEDARTTVLAIGEVANIEPLIVDESASTPAASEVAIAVVHAAPEAPAVDIFVTAPDDDLSGQTALTTLAFTQSADAGNLSAGEARIRAAVGDTVVYDSGTVDLAGFAGQKLFIAAIAATNAAELAASPIKLMVSNDETSVIINDQATAVSARVVHASPDAAAAAGGAVEVFATSDALGMNAVELIPTFNYTDVFPSSAQYASVPVGDYLFDVAPDSDTVGDSVFQSGSLSLTAGSEFTVIASGRVISTPAFELLVTEDSNRVISTEARVKVIHAAPAAGIVDVFVTPAGDASVADIEAGNVTPLLDDFDYAEITDYVSVAPGDYDIRVVAGGAVAINAESVALPGGLVANVIARGPSEPEGEPTDFGLILLTN